VNKPSATLVGVFVLGAITLVVAGVLFFGSGALLEKRFPFVSFFPGSVAGLKEGAAVTFRGVRVGQVASIAIRIDPETGSSIIQVNMELVPESVTVYGTPLPNGDREVVPALVQRGLTAQLVVQSYLTNLLNVDLDFRPGAKASHAGLSTTVPEVPTVPSDLEALTKRFKQIDIAKALGSLEHTLASVNAILESPELKQTLSELPGLVSTLHHTLDTIDGNVAALSGTGRDAIAGSAVSLQKTLASVQVLAEHLDRETASTLGAARGTFERAATAVDGVNGIVDPRGRTLIQVQRAVDDLAAAAARLRDLSERVDRDPSVLIRGR
jgi:phospholipid/cholesterol/gamma-HCH transport system substrate-binding protein